MKLINAFTIPAGSGHNFMVMEAFAGARVIIDPGFMAIIGGQDALAREDLNCLVLEAEVGVSDESIIEESKVGFEPGKIRAAIFYLGRSEDGEVALAIPQGEYEVNLILGYTDCSVLFLEHEIEDGKEEEYHFHIRPRKEKWKRAPRVLVVT
jgi:hypothetical protein